MRFACEFVGLKQNFLLVERALFVSSDVTNRVVCVKVEARLVGVGTSS